MTITAHRFATLITSIALISLCMCASISGCKTSDDASSDDEAQAEQRVAASSEDDEAFAERDWSPSERDAIEEQLALDRVGAGELSSAIQESLASADVNEVWKAAAENNGETPLIAWSPIHVEGDGLSGVATALLSMLETYSVNQLPVDVMTRMINAPLDDDLDEVKVLSVMAQNAGADYVGTGRLARSPAEGIAKTVTYEFTVMIIDANAQETVYEATVQTRKTATAPGGGESAQ